MLKMKQNMIFHWPNAAAFVVIRGVNISISYGRARGQATSLRAVASTEAKSGAKVTVRLVQHGKEELVTLTSP